MAFDYQAWLSRFPGTNFHELNIDWLIEQVKILGREFVEFEALNTVTYGGIWSIDQNYPRWTIVSSDSGNGYISIKPVPAGITIDNTDYWMKLYDFVTALGALEARVTALEGSVGSLSGTVTSLGNRVGSLELNITAIQTALTNSYKFANSDYSERTFLFIGDSYTGGLGPGITPWHEVMCNFLHPKAYYMSAEGGEGFQTNAGKHYLDRINDFIGASTATQRQSITDLFIVGGYNDIEGGVTDIISASNNPYNMTKCVEKCRQFFPNARIIIAMVARTPIDYLRGPHNITYINRCAMAYREGANELGCLYVMGSEVMLHDYRWYDSTHVHPNQLGCNYLGHFMAQWMVSGSWSFNYESNNARQIVFDHDSTTVVDGHNTVVSGGDAAFTELLTDEGVIIHCTDFSGVLSAGGSGSFDCSPAQTVAANTFNLGRINKATGAYFSFLGASNKTKIGVNVTFKDNSNGTHNIPGILTWSDNNELLLNLQYIDNSGNWLTVNGINTIWSLSGFTITLPLHSC